MGSTVRAVARLAAVAAALLVATPVVATVAHGEDAVRLPDELQGVASASGLSVISFKDPNPLPVGPGAFLTFEAPEVEGAMTADASRARTSLLYPGPVVAGGAALLCTAGAEPFCGQAPPPVLAEAEYPQHQDAALATDQLALRDPSAPVATGTGNGEAHVTARSSTSTARLAAYRAVAPDPARQAVLDALAATLDSLPGARRARDDALLSIGSGEVVQRIAPADDGRVRTEARAVLHDVRMLAGAVTIDSVTVSSFAVSDGGQVQDAGSTTRTAGLLVGGFPATIGPEGIELQGQSDHGQARQALHGVAAQVADAVHLAVDKLQVELRDGVASRTPDRTSAASDGLQLSIRSDRMTDQSPPQVPALCSVTGAVQDPLSSGGLSLPPLCAVPDVTGTRDSYTFQLGRASVLLTAHLYPDFSGEGTGVTGGDVLGGGGPDAMGPVGGGTPGGTGAGSSRRRVVTLPGVGDPGFLAFEARWLGDAAGGVGGLYLALAGAGVLLLLLSKALLRTAARTPGGHR